MLMQLYNDAYATFGPTPLRDFRSGKQNFSFYLVREASPEADLPLSLTAESGPEPLLAALKAAGALDELEHHLRYHFQEARGALQPLSAESEGRQFLLGHAGDVFASADAFLKSVREPAG